MPPYPFIGNPSLLSLVKPEAKGHPITCPEDLTRWMQDTHQEPNADGELTATFVISQEGQLLVNGRRSEHVVCAGGESVLSAGEITFEWLKGAGWRICQITNQSTGYCPAPGSWPAVEDALRKTGIPFPPFFTTAYEFRKCGGCGWINLIKDSHYMCGNPTCSTELER